MRVNPTSDVRARAAVTTSARTPTYPAPVISDDDEARWNAAAAHVRACVEDMRVAERDLDERQRARNAAVHRALPVIGTGWTPFARAVGTDADEHYLISPDLLRKIADQAPTED